MVSGICSAEESERHRVKIVSYLPGVGKMFRDDTQIQVVWKTRENDFMDPDLTGTQVAFRYRLPI